MIRHRHTFVTLGAFALVVGGVLAAIGVAGVSFGTEFAGVFLAVCPAVFLLPGALLLITGIRLSARHGRMRGLAGMLMGKDSLTLAEIAAALKVSEEEAVRLCVMAIAEGYVDAVFDPAVKVFRKKA